MPIPQRDFGPWEASENLGPTVVPGSASFPLWEVPSFVFPHLTSEAVSAFLQISRIGRDYTEPCLSDGSDLQLTGEGLRAACPRPLAPGLYILSACTLTTGSGDRFVLTHLGLGACFFEVTSSMVPTRSRDDVAAAIGAVAAHRTEELLRGFRAGEERSDDGDFQVYVFAKNCVLSRTMRLGAYTIEPIGGLGCGDEVQAYEAYFAAKGLAPVGSAGAAMADASANQPSFVAAFPHVHAPTIDQAMRDADEEVDRLCGVLALHRAAAASKFATVGRDPRTGQTRYGVHTPRFLGNYATGELCGESPELVKRHLEAVRGNQRLQLYTSLFREALAETSRDIAYFRLWNLLEAIVVFRDDVVGSKSRPRVANLLQGVFSDVLWSDETFAQCLEQASVEELTVIWCRRRNCLAHSGGCTPSEPRVCMVSGKWVEEYRACRDALGEMQRQNESVNRANDQYLKIMAEVVEMVVRVECARASGSPMSS